jgi:hypothetical protein
MLLSALLLVEQQFVVCYVGGCVQGVQQQQQRR